MAKDKTGVWTGAYAINPVNGKEIPIWIADYVLASYGTGAIMAVPAHDERDWEFAKQFNLEIIPVLEGGNVADAAYTEDGPHINSGFLDGLDKAAAIEKMVAWLEAEGVGNEKVTYRLRDWLFSRQRYWGEPIPIIHWEDGTTTAVPEDQLPLVLPVTKDIKPSGTGESPLANLTDWLEVTRVNHNLGKIHLQEDVVFEAVWKQGNKSPEKAPIIRKKTFRLKGPKFRTPGLGKDVTNKYLGGLPGLQKEGCDGIITSARFILHKMPVCTQTVCLEFYGAAGNAGPAIYQISQLFDSHPEGVMLAGLEHLDDRYLHAINYAPKSGRGDLSEDGDRRRHHRQR